MLRTRAALHGECGPLQWAVAQLLSLAARSATAAALTALHLSALWLRYPQAAQAYQSTWLHLLLYSCEEAGGGGGFQPGLQVSTASLLAACRRLLQ